MTNKQLSDKDTKILTVRNLPSYNVGFIIQGKFLQNLGYKLFDQVLISADANGNINISKYTDNGKTI